MNKRKLAWGAIAIALVISVIGAAWTFFGVDEIAMTQAEVQAKIDAKLPYTSPNGVQVSGVNLDLSGDKIGLTVHSQAERFHMRFDIDAATRGTLVFNVAEGAFYFHPDTLKVIDAKADDVSVGTKVGTMLDKLRISSTDKAQIMSVAEGLAQSAIQHSAELWLDHMPVYKLPHTGKGYVVRAFLKDVTVKDGKIIAHLSLWQFTKTVALFMLALAASIGLAVALIANPEWGLAILVLGSI